MRILFAEFSIKISCKFLLVLSKRVHHFPIGKMESNFLQIMLVGVSFALQFHRMGALKCGTVNIVHPTILGGSETIRGEWPFIVAIHYRSNYICGGTIISYRHILTGERMK